MSNAITWKEPPARVNGRTGRYSDFFDALRENPGQWALFPGNGSSVAAQSIKKGKYIGTEQGQFEAVTRKETDDAGNSRVAVYARFVG